MFRTVHKRKALSNYDITEILIEIEEESHSEAFDYLFPILYDKIKELASSQLNREYDLITIQPTELVHELYIKLVDQSRVPLKSKKQFYRIASYCMRQILIDHARRKKADKRGGANFDITLHPEQIAAGEHEENILAIDELLVELRVFDERAADIVEMKFFSGISTSQIAEILEISEKTVKRDWAKAKLWIYSAAKNKSSK